MRNLTTNFRGRAYRGCRYLQTFADGGIDCALYGSLIQQFTNRRLPNQAKQLHARLNLLSVVPDNFLGSKLVNLYAKTGNLSHARHVFDKIPQKNTFAYNAMLIAYSLNERHVDAVSLFAELALSTELEARPNNYSVTSVLKSLGSFSPSSDVKVGKEVHGYVVRNVLGGDVFVGNALISYYAKCVAIVLARKVFDEMTHRDVVTWNSMIAAYSQGGFYEQCKGLYREMLGSSGLMPNPVTVVSVLQACAQSLDLVLGMEVHRFVTDNQIQVDMEVNNVLIAMYARCGRLEIAKELFQDMSDRDNVTYGSIISGYMFHGFVDEAMEIFRSAKSLMVSSWNAVISGLVQNNRCEQVIELLREMVASGLRPNQVTLSSILPALSYFSNLRGGKEVHGYAVKCNYDKNVYVTSAIIDIYGKTGYIDGARIVFHQSKERSLILWTALISAHSSQGDANSTLLLFYEMLNKGIKPDPVTFTAVLSACAHCGMVEKSWEVFNSMSEEFGIQPLVEQYACMTTALCRAGRLSEATEFVYNMPIEPSPKVWGALLHGSSESGDVELGKLVYDRLCVDEPGNTGNYTIMANLYAQAGRWKEADEVRDRMSELGLKKIPGCSSVGTGKRLKPAESGKGGIFITRLEPE
ncbi:Pentatricopeptide repeat-containing protein At2g37310 [Linum perenne]